MPVEWRCPHRMGERHDATGGGNPARRLRRQGLRHRIIAALMPRPLVLHLDNGVHVLRPRTL